MPIAAVRRAHASGAAGRPWLVGRRRRALDGREGWQALLRRAPRRFTNQARAVNSSPATAPDRHHAMPCELPRGVETGVDAGFGERRRRSTTGASSQTAATDSHTAFTRWRADQGDGCASGMARPRSAARHEAFMLPTSHLLRRASTQAAATKASRANDSCRERDLGPLADAIALPRAVNSRLRSFRKTKQQGASPCTANSSPQPRSLPSR